MIQQRQFKKKEPIADKKFSATRPCGSKGIGGCDACMKLCLSSSRCASCPAKGEPAQAGSQPCAGRGDTAGDAEADERAGRGTAAPKPMSSRMPSVLDS